MSSTSAGDGGGTASGVRTVAHATECLLWFGEVGETPTHMRWRNGFLAIWIAGFIGSLVTGSIAFMLLPLMLACVGLALIAADWRGIAGAVWRDSLWPRYPGLTLRLFRQAIGGGGFIICLAVTVAAWLTALN